MPTKVCIIKVELANEIPNIITEEVTALSSQNQEQLETARAIMRQVEHLRIQRPPEAAIELKLRQAHERLLAAGEAGVPVPELLRELLPQITTGSAFTLRMKARLKKLDNPHVLVRTKVGGKECYLLRPYNA